MSTQLNAARIGLEDTKSLFEEVYVQLEMARQPVESARAHLEMTTDQKGIIDAAKEDLLIAEMRYDVVITRQKAVNSQFEAARARLDFGIFCAAEEKSQLEDEKAALVTKHLKAESENVKLKTTVYELEEKLKHVKHQLDHCNCKDKITGNVSNPKVFFEVTINGMPAGRIVFTLFADTTPLAAENFRALCTGEKGLSPSGQPLHFKGTLLNRGAVDLCEGGIGYGSIYGPTFPVEKLVKKHSGPGILFMMNKGSDSPPTSYGSLFFINLRDTVEYDGKHAVFGQVIEGMDVVIKVHQASRGVSIIADCGQDS